MSTIIGLKEQASEDSQNNQIMSYHQYVIASLYKG